jgi:hypothetical protein
LSRTSARNTYSLRGDLSRRSERARLIEASEKGCSNGFGRTKLSDPAIRHGRIFKTTGDGLLVELCELDNETVE